MQFLFDDIEKEHQHYMSLMESIHCLLLFKNYHKAEYRKRDNRPNNNNNNNNSNNNNNDNNTHDPDFVLCNKLLNRKLTQVGNEKGGYTLGWAGVRCFVFLFVCFSCGSVSRARIYRFCRVSRFCLCCV